MMVSFKSFKTDTIVPIQTGTMVPFQPFQRDTMVPFQPFQTDTMAPFQPFQTDKMVTLKQRQWHPFKPRQH